MVTAARPWLQPEAVQLDARAGSKRSVLEQLSRLLAPQLGTSSWPIFDALVQREGLGSTALGCGVALPHARLTTLQEPAAAFIRLCHPVPFDAPDEEPVLFVLGLLLPRRDPERQLELLAGIATRFSSADFRMKLAQAGDVRSAWVLLTRDAPP